MIKTLEKNAPFQPQVPVVSQDGLSTPRQLMPFSPIGRETIRKLSLPGKFPSDIRMSTSRKVYRNEDFHARLKDPVGYRAE
jgi:hypothetical protein